MSATTSSSRSMWIVPAGLVLLSLVPAVAGTVRLAELAGEPAITPANQRFVSMPLPVVLHILAVVPFSIVGAFQFSSGFRRRFRGWHRAAGRVLVVLGLLAALSGVWMTLTYPWANNDGEAVYLARLIVGCAMVGSIGLAIDAIRRRDFTTHGEWMTRAYAIGLGAGTQVFTHLPWFIAFGDELPGELPRAIMMIAAWVINAVVAEVIIRRARRGARPRTRAASKRVDGRAMARVA